MPRPKKEVVDTSKNLWNDEDLKDQITPNVTGQAKPEIKVMNGQSALVAEGKAVSGDIVLLNSNDHVLPKKNEAIFAHCFSVRKAYINKINHEGKSSLEKKGELVSVITGDAAFKEKIIWNSDKKQLEAKGYDPQDYKVTSSISILALVRTKKGVIPCLINCSNTNEPKAKRVIDNVNLGHKGLFKVFSELNNKKMGKKKQLWYNFHFEAVDFSSISKDDQDAFKEAVRLYKDEISKYKQQVLSQPVLSLEYSEEEEIEF